MRRIEGYVIVSADGMLADAKGEMPDSISNEADQRFFQDCARPRRRRSCTAGIPMKAARMPRSANGWS